MKKFKYMLSALVVALVLTCVAKAPMAVKADVAAAPDYTKEILTVTGVADDATVYYQVVKDNSKEVKTTAWLPATKTTDGWAIDMSGITKDCFIVYTTDKTLVKPAELSYVEIKTVVKSLKATIDYTKDAPATLIDALASVIVTPVTGNAVVYNKYSTVTAEQASTAVTSKYGFAWKRGANGTWASNDTGFATAYQMLRSSNSTLYVKVVAGTNGTTPILPSKEVKIKVAKTALAPTVKVDHVKGTVAIKNGMEIKQGATVKVVPVYDKNATAADTFAAVGAVAATKTKVSAVTPAEIIAALGWTATEGNGGVVTFDVRTSATAKKYASWYATISFKAPAAAPAVAGGKEFVIALNTIEKTMTANTKDVFTPVTGRTLEYALVPNNSDVVDYTKVKFTAVPTDGIIDLSKSYGKDYTYYTTEGTKKQVKTETCKIVLRYAAVKEDLKATTPVEGLFASEMLTSTAGTALPVITLTCTKCTVEIKNGEKAVKIVDGKFSAPKAATLTFTIKPAVTSGKVVDTVKIGETTVSLANGAYTGSYAVPDADGTIAVTVLETDPTE